MDLNVQSIHDLNFTNLESVNEYYYQTIHNQRENVKDHDTYSSKFGNMMTSNEYKIFLMIKCNFRCKP